MEVFAGWSYDEIILPMFDYQDLFSRGMGAEKAERTYRFVDRDGGLLALRPELTSLVARTVATRFTRKPRPLRLCYSGEVFRYDEPTERAAREFHQLGVEHIGEPSIAADLEVLLIAAEVLTSLELDGFRIALSHVDFFNGIAGHLRLDEAHKAALRDLIDRRNSQALDRFLQATAPQVDAARRRQFCDLIQLAGQEETLARADDLLINEQSRGAIRHLSGIYAALQTMELETHFAIDLGDAADLDYYTGLTFKVYVPDWGVEIGSGGRYDRLIGNFGQGEPAVGFSFSLDGLAGAISRQDQSDAGRAGEPPQLIPYDGQLAEAFSRARKLRRQGRKVRIGANQER